MNPVWSNRFPGRGAHIVLIVAVVALIPLLIPGAVQAQPLALTDAVVSRSSGGTLGAGGSFESAISGDGRYVAFSSGAANLVPNDTNNALDVFVFDRVAGTIRRVSTDAAGVQANRSSDSAAITPDGNFVAFASPADFLVPGDSINSGDIFLKNLQSGAIQRVTAGFHFSASENCDAPDVSDNAGVLAYRCSFAPESIGLVRHPLAGGLSTTVVTSSIFNVLSKPRISGDGRSVAFVTDRNGVVVNDSNNTSDAFVYLHDTGTIRLASNAQTGGSPLGVLSDPPAISRDGCQVAFASSSNGFVSQDFNGLADIFVRNLCLNRIERANLEVSDGQTFEAQGGGSARPSISADARYVAFQTSATNLKSNNNQIFGNVIVVRDRQSPPGATGQVNTFVVGGVTFGNFAVEPSLSDDGFQVAAQVSGSSDQIVALTNGVAFAQPVALLNNPNGGEMFAPVPSGDANLVLVSSDAAGFDLGWGGNDADGNEDAFVFRPAIGGNGACMEQASMSSGDFNSPCFRPALKHEKATTPTTPDIPCPNPNATEICAPSIEPTMAASRMLVAFVTADSAVAVAKNETKIERDARRKGNSFGIYLRDLVSGAVFRVSTALPGGVGTVPQLSADGNSIVFVTNEDRSIDDLNTGADAYQIRIKPNLADGFDPPICLSCKDTVGSGSNPPGAGNPVVSADGNVVAMNVPTTGGGTQILLRNLVNGSSQRMGTPTGNSQRPRMDYSGSRLVFGSDANLDGADANAKPDVYLYENCCNKITRMSKPISGDASDASADAIISGDGRTVSYVSLANNLDPNDPASNGKQHVFVQRLDGARVRMRLARNSQGQLSDNDSFRPALGYNGNALFFDSLAGNLKNGEDFNPGRDVFRRFNPVSADIVFGAGFE